MHLKLYYAENDVMEVSENRGFDPLKIHALLSRLKEQHEIDFTIVDVSQCSAAELNRAYDAAVKAAVWNRYPIRKVFGTNKSSASFFGGGVPALLVYEAERPVHVFPHEEPGGEAATIRDYLDKLLRGDGGGKELAQRMDELRKAIGPVGATTNELVQEGRHR